MTTKTKTGAEIRAWGDGHRAGWNSALDLAATHAAQHGASPEVVAVIRSMIWEKRG